MNRAVKMAMLAHKRKEDREHEHKHDHEDKKEEYRLESLTKAEATSWVNGMVNEDGTTGAHFSISQVEQSPVLESTGHSPIHLWAAANMMYSDYCKVLKKYGVDRSEVYMELAAAFLEDRDAMAEDKLSAYYHCVVKSGKRH